MALRIAVLGMHRPTLRGFRSGEWDQVFCMAHDAMCRVRGTHAFEAHSEAIVRKHCPAHVERLKDTALTMPLTTAWPWSEDLGARHVPYTALHWGKHIESSVAYMTAHAIERAPEEIGLFGVDLDHAEEYGYQKPNMMRLVGIAEGLGIKVWIHPDSKLHNSQWTGGCYGHPDNVNDIDYRLDW